MSGAARALHWRDQRACASYSERSGKPSEPFSCLGLGIVIILHERGIPSKHKSSACVDYVPALCTHRPSLLPIEWLSEASGLTVDGRKAADCWKVVQTWSFRGSKSRNKVSVGEPAEGSLMDCFVCIVNSHSHYTTKRSYPMIICLNANCPLSQSLLSTPCAWERERERETNGLTSECFNTVFILYVRAVQHTTTWPYVRLRSRGECANVFVLFTSHFVCVSKGSDCRGQSLDSLCS